MVLNRKRSDTKRQSTDERLWNRTLHLSVGIYMSLEVDLQRKKYVFGYELGCRSK